MAPVLKILGVLRLPPGGSLSMGKRGTVPKIWCAVPFFFSVCKWGLSWDRKKLHFYPKVAKMGSVIGHRIDYNGVGALRGQRHIPTKINPSTPQGNYR